jgi:hypothetical protein
MSRVLEFFRSDCRSQDCSLLELTSYSKVELNGYDEPPVSIAYSEDRGPGWRSRYSDLLLAGRCGDRIPVGARFSAPLKTGPGTHTAAYIMGTVSLSQG